MAFGLFSSMFGRDCSEIETDPRADPFDKEICRNFRQFEEIVEDFSRIPSLEREEFLIPKEDTPPADDPQSLRDSILSQDHSKKKSGFHRYSEDKDLDEDVSNDPQMLDRVLRDDKNGIEPKGFSRSYSSSVRVSTIRKEDGTVEQRRTVTDSEGKEEVTITTTYPDGSSDTVTTCS